MKPKELFLIGILITLFSCNNDDNQDQLNINGQYIGTFERNGNTSIVELNFNDRIYTGESNTEKFPAICRGSYSVSKNTITIINGCPWTTNFDSTLIFSGEWEFSFKNDTLVLNNLIGDKYKLAPN